MVRWLTRKNGSGRQIGQKFRTAIGGSEYDEPEMKVQEVTTVRAKAFSPYQKIPLYDPKSDLLPSGVGLSDYFKETRTPDEVRLAQEDTVRFKASLQTQEDIERARLATLRELSGFPFTPAAALQAVRLQGVATTPTDIIRAFSPLPPLARERVIEATKSVPVRAYARKPPTQRFTRAPRGFVPAT